jgi:tetratricopeptide (TPR) repeat protein
MMPMWAGSGPVDAGLPDAAMTDIANALEMKPDHPAALYQRSRIWEDQGKPRQALADLEKACSAPIVLPHAWIARARLLHTLGKSAEAVDVLSELIRRKSDQVPWEAWMLRSQIYVYQKDIEKAILDISHIVSAGKAPDSLFFRRAVLSLQTSDTAAAVQDLDRLLREEPRHEPARRLRSRLMSANGKMQAALTDLDYLILEMKIRDDAELYASRAFVLKGLKR